MTAFPSPSRIRITEDTKWLERNTNFFFSNLEREFGKQAKKNSVSQTVRLGDKATSRHGNHGALWVKNFSLDGVSIEPDQVQHGIAVANERLAGTGWRVVDIQPLRVPTTNRCAMGLWHASWFDSPDMGAYLTGEKQKPPMPMMPALDVVMEYACDDACAAK